MSRPLRIKYEGAVYHVMNRGQDRRAIFRSDHDYEYFLRLCKDCVQQWKIMIHAFSLMPNHYHLLIETPLANISRAMRHINGLYTQYYNRQNKKDGCLFKGRYKAILVDEDAYLVELLRYIHLNPVKACLVANPAQHKWTGHRYYIKSYKNSDWITTDRLLSMFGKDQGQARKKLQQFMNMGVPRKLEERLSKKKWPSVFSSENFKDWVEWNFVKDIKNRDLKYHGKAIKIIEEPRLKKILTQFFGLKWEEITQAKGAHKRSVRALCVGMYRRHLLWDYENLFSASDITP
ncbi:MAG: transposase [Deltaproteobacteria bacterium]|nr:transposase [Deltaproteobacteria bacterium]